MLGIPARHFTRYYEILSVFMRHGLGYMFMAGNSWPMQERNLAVMGVHLRNAFSELGPAFIKLGQLVSTRSDLVPQPIVQELVKLQDRVPPLAFRDIRRVLEESLQSPLESVFREFEPIPLAAASIGQVHYAVLPTGEKAAVKVQRPFLQETVKTDLEIFQVFVRHFEQKTQWGKHYPIGMLLEEFSMTLKGELNFLNEGHNADKISKSTKHNANILIPKIHWELTRPSILTMEYIPGIPLHQIICSQDPAYNTHKIADRLSKALLRQILLEGCFHADPHPGNILILPEDKIALIDFGITGHLSSTMKDQVLALVSALIRGKDALLLKILSQMGVVPEAIDQTGFLADISAFRQAHLKVSSPKFSLGKSTQDFFAVVSRYGIFIPSEFILIGKSLLTLEGVLNVLDPTLNLTEQAKPFSRRFLWGKFVLKSIWKKIGGTSKTDTPGLPIHIQ